MNKYYLSALFFFIAFLAISFKTIQSNSYQQAYELKINDFIKSQSFLIKTVQECNQLSGTNIDKIKQAIGASRNKMKSADIWLRYLEPLAYKKINSPLPVEWETEVFEKFEKPYKRVGAGLTLAELYLEEENPDKDTLLHLLTQAEKATGSFLHDSIVSKIKTFDHFYFCNRLFLLNLASIYTTGFECPDTALVIPELKVMLSEVNTIYATYNQSFSSQQLSAPYMTLFAACIQFAVNQPERYSHFDHFTFIKDYVNPLFALNQQLIRQYGASSRSNLDYALNKTAASIFDKSLYMGQITKGIFLRVNDEQTLQTIDRLGEMLFFDPILSANNQRSCVSCHDPKQFFTDTLRSTSLQFNEKEFLPRNSPSLLNTPFNHLAMLDGKHQTLQHQGKAVITNPIEMGSNENEVLEKILSCKEYKAGFTKLLKHTPQEKEITLEHIVSALTFYYGKFSNGTAAFDNAMNNKTPVNKEVIEGFNLFMSKSQCASCHFVPQFNGVKPPYIGSEFEVLGTPEDPHYKSLSKDKGRHDVNPATETMNAFRTGTLRNAEKTKPYMHNGVFKTLDEVIEFYNGGGGAGRGLVVENQTLSSDSLRLTKKEKIQLISFIKSLNEEIILEVTPEKLPLSKNKTFNTRKVGGEY